MDANGQGFWLLADAGHWRWRHHAHWDPGCRVLRLTSTRRIDPPTDPGAAFAAANAALERVPMATDSCGGSARWDPARNAVLAASQLPGEVERLSLSSDPSDLLVDREATLYLVGATGVRLHDLRARWPDHTVHHDDFAPWRAAAHREGGLWLVERGSGRIARLHGRPMPFEHGVDYAPGVFRPDPENCRPPGIDVLPELDWSPGERPVAIASHPEGALAVLTWRGLAEAWLHRLDERGQRIGPPLRLDQGDFAYALAFIDSDRIAVRVPRRRDAPAYLLSAAEGEVLPLSGEIFPLLDGAIEAPFAHRLAGPPRYPIDGDARGTDDEPGVASLHRLSVSRLARRGEARHFGQGEPRLIDSGSVHTVWHRLVAEAKLPPRTGMVVLLAATPDNRPPPVDDAEAWLPHHFGEPARRREPQAPRAAYEHAASELPHHPGLGKWTREPGVAGLWSVLIQNPRQRVRRLVGRYLWVRVELSGDGRATPELAALRAWASRFSYRDRYLPRLYREAEHGEPARRPGERVDSIDEQHEAALDAGGIVEGALLERLRSGGLALGASPRVEVLAPGRHWLLHDSGSPRAWRLLRERAAIHVHRPEATPADFLERMLCNFEGVLTGIEDRVAAAHLLTDPAVVPEPQLAWLGRWIGVAFDPGLPEARRRDWLRAAPRLARLHGTRAGLELALDIATAGAVSGGEIVVVEDFRLRRLLSTLLGVDLNRAEDPLLPGLMVSGNSVVGDTLVLGEEESTELMALFREEAMDAGEREAVRDFRNRLAHRATVLVHQAVSPQDLGLIRRIVDMESPAHADVRIETATWPLLVGVAALVGVDTYLGPDTPPAPVRLDRSAIGVRDYLLGPVALDPRQAGGRAPRPTPPPFADAGPRFTVQPDTPFVLDGRRSSAAEGRRIDAYVWWRLPPDA